MIVMPDATVIGGTNMLGISVPGAINIGSGKWHSQPSLIIDLMTAAVDPRITYAGPSHLYWSAGGLLEYSGKDNWPLEYHDGMPIGHHEPEPAATNFLRGNQFDSIAAGQSARDWSYVGTVPVINESPIGWKQISSSEAGLLTCIYSESRWAFIAAAESSPALENFSLITRTTSNPSASVLRWYISRVDAKDHLCGYTQEVPAGEITASVLRKSGIFSVLPQLETGPLATSPIVTQAGASADRPASSVEINTEGYSRVKIFFSNGDVASYQSADSTFSLPPASLHWTERYIQRIELRR